MTRRRKLSEFLFHSFACCFFAYTDSTSIFIPGLSDTYGGRYKFLTVIDLKLLICYHGYSAILDVTYIFWSSISKGSKVNRHKFRKNCLRRDYVFSSIVFPTSWTVSILFWTLYNMNPDMVQSAETRKHSPAHGFHNHAVHTAPMLVSLLECFITKHRLSVSFMKGCIGWVVFCILYLSWILWVAYTANIWVYPFFKVMSSAARGLFFIGVFLFEAMLYQIGVNITRSYWRIGGNKKQIASNADEKNT